MTPYTIALAGKAYLTKAICLGKIQQTTGKKSTAVLQFSSFDLMLSLHGQLGIHTSRLLFKSLPYPYSIANQPTSMRGKKSSGNALFPGIFNNIKAVKTVLQSATNSLSEAIGFFRRLISDTAYLTTSFDVIVSKSFSGRGNYELMPVYSSR